MPSFAKKLLFFALFLGIFILVVLYMEPPESWEEASLFQIMAFFLPLLLAITTLLDILIHYLPQSFILALGTILWISFYAAGKLNILSGLLVILIVLLSWRIFPKMRLPRFRLTRSSKIPKLHMQKQEPPKLRRLRRLK